MEKRNFIQEMRYNQALGYAWGVTDGAHGKPPIGNVPWKVDSLAFADWYADGGHQTGPLAHAFLAFSHLPLDEQVEMGRRHKRLPPVIV